MTLIKSIAIEKPCDQSWQQMTVESNGRYCGHCCKTVVDFTRMSNEEIIQYLSAGEHVCGRFENYQFNSLNNYLAIKNERHSSWKGLLAGLSLMLALPSTKTEAKPRYQILQMPIDSKRNAKTAETDSTLTTIVQGTIIDRGDKTPIPGVTVTIKGSPKGTVTNVAGKFVLDSKIGDVLVVTFVGYERQEILVRECDQRINLELQENTQMLGEPVMMEYKRPSIVKRVWHKIKKIF
jgi:hypothetical protein